MDINDERIKYVVKHTEILRAPKQSLYTFGTTNIGYYLVTEPAYSELMGNITETVIREGRVIAERPRIVTPYYLAGLEGFGSEARRYFETLLRERGPSISGLFYTYKNEPKELNIVSDSMQSVVDKLNTEIDQRGDPLAAIIKGQDELWDVSLLKFIYEVTRSSVQDNLRQMDSRGLLNTDAAGIPADARLRIEELFQMVAKGEIQPGDLKKELDRWGLFDEYQDRFFSLFGERR
ncbi:MAG: hypothetical protein HYY41_03485 [Chloroflexi bacterium]|nr:hypothetical protein [Chloroflexota bacterium]MBI2979871.1 hypothetical protein [Chloroflexota bacterium]